MRRTERGLQILAPVIRKITPEIADEEERRVVGFESCTSSSSPKPKATTPRRIGGVVGGDLPAHRDLVSGLIGEAGFDLQAADLERLGEANAITDW